MLLLAVTTLSHSPHRGAEADGTHCTVVDTSVGQVESFLFFLPEFVESVGIISEERDCLLCQTVTFHVDKLHDISL